MMKELHQLAQLADSKNPEQALCGLTVVVIHIKPSFKQGPNPQDQIAKQLNELNELGARFIIPQQGQLIEL